MHAFSRRFLGKGSDRIAALLDVVTELAHSTGDQYLAGLWRNFLVQDLLWCVYGPGCPTLGGMKGYKGRLGPEGKRTGNSRAPSWSWLAIDGHIRYLESHLDSNTDHEILAELEDVTTAKALGVELLSRPSSSMPITLRGIMKQACPVAYHDTLSNFVAAVGESSVDDEGHLHDDTPEDLEVNEAAEMLNNLDVRQDRDWDIPTDLFKMSSNEPDEEPVMGIDAYALDSALEKVMVQDRGIRRLHPDHVEDVNEDPDRARSQLYLYDPKAMKVVGFWAPDVLTEVSSFNFEQFRTQGARGPMRMVSINFLAISRHKGFVWTLGLLPVSNTKGTFMRVGLGWWIEQVWDRIEGIAAQVKII